MQEDSMNTIPQMVEDVREGKLPRRHFMRTLASLGISTAAVTTITSAAASMPTARVAAPTHPDQQQEHNLHLHEQHLAHQTQSNTDALHHDYAEHAVVEDTMYSQPFVGRATIIARKSTGMAAIPDLRIHVTNRVAHRSQVVAEWTATGTHSSDLPGLPATGRSFSIQGVTVVVRENGKIVREAIYYDMQEVRRQLGSQ